MPLEGHLMHEQLEYTTRNEAEAHLNNSINKYADTDLSDWATLFVESIQPMSIPDKELSAKVTVGCIHFFENIKYMVNNSYLNKAFEKEG